MKNTSRIITLFLAALMLSACAKAGGAPQNANAPQIKVKPSLVIEEVQTTDTLITNSDSDGMRPGGVRDKSEHPTEGRGQGAQSSDGAIKRERPTDEAPGGERGESPTPRGGREPSVGGRPPQGQPSQSAPADQNAS